jgi:hypothetical protein
MKAIEFYEMYDIPHPKKCLPREDEMCEKLSQDLDYFVGQIDENRKEIDLLKSRISENGKLVKGYESGVKKWVYSSLVLGLIVVGGQFGLGVVKDAEISRLREVESQKVVYRDKDNNSFIPFGMGVITSFAFYKLLDR